jgi:diguanylate cyclase (GGDEF)-like protein
VPTYAPPHPSPAARPPTRGQLTRNRTRHRWLLVAVIIALAGTIGSVIGAVAVGHTHAAQARAGFKLQSAQIAANVEQTLQHEGDLVADAGAYLLSNPHASNADLRRWTRQAHVAARYPELLGFVKVVLVPASQLATYAAHAEHDPSGPLGPHGSFVVTPAGARPFYCFAQLSSTPAKPAGLDSCAGSNLLMDARASGRSTVVPLRLGRDRLLVAQTPLYRGAAAPRTVAARRRAFIGWLSLIVAPGVVLRSAARDYPHTAVVLRRNPDGSRSIPVAFALGKVPHDASSLTFDLHNGSSVQTFTVPAGGGVFRNADSFGLLVGGTALSVLVAALLFVLATGRARALRLVDVKTGELAFAAMHDPLTSLPNRALVRDRATQLLARARRDNSPVAALFIDIDGFKHVNDTLGHAAGDELLRVVSRRLDRVMRDSDTVGRFGGDEFVVLLAGDADGDPQLLAERLLDVLRQPIELVGANAWARRISASIGIAVGQSQTADELLRDADLALYRAKAAGKNRYVIFEQSMQAAEADQRELERELGRALTDGQLFLLFQPTFDLRSRRMTGVEALIRWRHPTRGVLPPDRFIPLAEDTLLIVPIGAWVLETACRQAARWAAAGHDIGMSVNVSEHQLDRPEFVAEVSAALQRNGLDPDRLTLEITESVLMRDAVSAAARLGDLKALGVRIAIDDFGTGYSSLAHLRRLPVDALKIDRSFISGISASRQSAALMRTLLQLGKALGLETLGEGIEEPGQLEQLQREACDSGQGFLFSEPLDAVQVQQFFTRNQPPVSRRRGAAQVDAVSRAR